MTDASASSLLDHRLRNSDSRARIADICAELLSNVPVRPTNLVAVGRKLGVVSFRSRPDLPYSGLLRRRSDGHLAVEYAPARRARFTIAHELGHAYLMRSGEQPTDEESFCDRFAAELLMPSALLRAEVAEGLTCERLFGIADTFGVSLHSATVQCAVLTPIGALTADRRGLLWRVGAVRLLDDFLRARVARVLESRDAVRESVSRLAADGPEPWLLEGQRLPWRETDAFVLLRPQEKAPIAGARP